MYIRALKALWFLSVLGFLAAFLYIYAALPEEVILPADNFLPALSKNVLFYVSLMIVAGANLVTLFAELSFYKKKALKAWVFGQAVFCNLFFALVLAFIMMVNREDTVRFEQMGWLIYGGLIMMVSWAVGWGLYFILQALKK